MLCVFGASFSYDLCINHTVERCVLGVPAKDDIQWGGNVLVTFGDVEWRRFQATRKPHGWLGTDQFWAVPFIYFILLPADCSL